jgi:recombination protein RecA
MFSMSLASSRVAPILASQAFPSWEADRAQSLPFGLRPLDDALPTGGLPRGAVVEIAAPRGLARATSIALSLCASAQAQARLRGAAATTGAWCAWIDPTETLFAPAVAGAGVDLSRLLVVRPPHEALARVAVRVAASRAFAVLVADVAGVPGSLLRENLNRWPTIVRRLALAVTGSDTTVVLITDVQVARSTPLPVAMRLEIDRVDEERLIVRVAKDRRGHVTSARPIVLPRTA